MIRQAERRWRSRRGDLFPEAPALAWPTLTEDGAELTVNQWGNLTHVPRSGLSVPRAFPPGDFIREELEARGWTQRDLAEIIGRPVQTVSAIVNAKKEITPQTAVALGAALGTSAAFWLNLQTAYQLASVGPPDPAIATRARRRAASIRQARAM